MKRQFTFLLAVVAVVAVMLFSRADMTAQVQNKDQAALKAAMDKETLQGDLKGAIEQYKKIAQSKDRSIAARAIVRMAECYQKLGDAEARKLYERVIQEYSDQKEPVALARSRLAVGGAALVARGDRAVWTGPNVDFFGRVSPDGKFISFVDWNNGRLMIRDLEKNTDRALTAGTPNYSEEAEWSAISKDGKQIAYDWVNAQGQGEFRISSLQGSGYAEHRVLNKSYFSPFDWSFDGKWIAAVRRVQQTTHEIGLISVADGSFRRLRSVDGNAFATSKNNTSIRFSPDGKYIAYDRPSISTNPQRDVFVLSIDGNVETQVVVHNANDQVMGWSPDGRLLLFSSDRTGSVDLWALPFANGKAQGIPERLKPNIGVSFSLGITDEGSLYVHKQLNTRDVAVAPIDLAAGKLLGPAVSFAQGSIEGGANPRWSPDGTYLAYQACDTHCLNVRSVDTGQTRRLAPTLMIVRGPSWSPDGRSLLALGTDITGREGIFQVDVQSGEATSVILDRQLSTFAQWSPDGKKIYFNRRSVFVERDLASGVERDVYQDPDRRFGTISPDGRFLAIAREDQSTRTARLLLVPIAGGPPREILRLEPSEHLFGPGDAWLHDSSGLIIQKHTGSRWELWLIPITGAAPRKLDIDPMLWREGVGGEGSVIQQGDQGFSLSPDGRKIAVMQGKVASEIWALENFLR